MSKIKVVHVMYSFEVGGIETLVLSLLNGLNKDLFEVHLITLTNDRLKLIHSLNNDIKVHCLDLKNKKNIISLIKIINQFRDLIAQINPTIIHNHLSAGSFFLVCISLKLIKFQLVHIKTIHSSGYLYSNKNIFDKLRLFSEIVSMKLIKTYLISISGEVYQNNIKYFSKLMQDNILIPNGIDLKKYDKSNYKHILKSNFSFSEDSILVTYVARLDNGKNHDFLIDLWNEVLKKVPNAILCFAGDGKINEYLIETTIKNKLDDKIVFLGSIDNVPELLSITDIAVFPSSFEGFGLVMLEKFAMGLAVVASDIEPFKEIAVDGKSAFLVSLKDKQKYIDKIVLLAKDSFKREEMGRNAYIEAQRFSIDNTIKLHEKYYLECIKGIFK